MFGRCGYQVIRRNRPHLNGQGRPTQRGEFVHMDLYPEPDLLCGSQYPPGLFQVEGARLAKDIAEERPA